MDKHLHIVAFAVPYPVVHGGLSDLFYKLVALHDAGIKIHLHCFSAHRVHQPELDKYCTSVQYYQRKGGLRGFSLSLPYIVSSRSSRSLRKHLQADDHPILLEGIHSSYIFNDPAFASRKIIVRLHNVEYQYYDRLFRTSSSFFKKMYYLFESRLLKKYESAIAKKDVSFLAVSENDRETYRSRLGAKDVEFLPVFTDGAAVHVEPGTGSFCLYHGNLSVAENEHAVLWLSLKVFSDTNVPLVIAGKDPSPRLTKIVERLSNINLVANPSSAEMSGLMRTTQCHVLPSFNSTGVKLKVINALFNGRHCIVNKAAVWGSGLEDLCHVADSAAEFREAVFRLFSLPVNAEETLRRSAVLSSLFDNKRNAETLIRKLW